MKNQSSTKRKVAKKLILNRVGVRRALVSDVKASATFLYGFREDSDEKVRLSVAKNPNATPTLLHIMSKDKSYAVRRAVFYNPRTDPGTLSSMVGEVFFEPRKSGNTEGGALNTLASALGLANSTIGAAAVLAGVGAICWILYKNAA